MRPHFSDRFVRNYKTASAPVRRAFDRKLALLLHNLRHPSLHAKKYDEQHGIWQARVTKDWRFYFMINGDTYRLLDIVPHPK